MNWPIRVRPTARLEILEITHWYAEQRSGLGSEFTSAMDATLQRLRENPFQYQIVHGELRRAPLHRFPYAVIYSIDVEVIILGCIHGRRDPRTWMQRR